jgi:ribokinase
MRSSADRPTPAGGRAACVWVVGSIHMDIVAFAERHPQPGETLAGSRVRLHPGGKGANQAVAACRAGAPTALVGRLGDDAFGHDLYAFLTAEGLELKHTKVEAGLETGIALIVVAVAENTIVAVAGAGSHLDAAAVEDIDLRQRDVVLAQLETPQAATAAAFTRARAVGALTVLNPSPSIAIQTELLEATDVFVVNLAELASLAGLAYSAAREADPIVLARRVQRTPEQAVIVTLGADGVVAVGGGMELRVSGHRVNAVDTTGAGDCFVGNLAAHLSTGAQMPDAIAEANLAASLCVQQVGAATAMPRRSTGIVRL